MQEINDYKVGDKVLLVNERPSNWVSSGGMDKYLNTTQVITYIHDTTFKFKGDGGWSFMFSNIVKKVPKFNYHLKA